MTRIITTPKALLVEVPEGLIGKPVVNASILSYSYRTKGGGQMDIRIYLPPASYGDPVLASEATVGQKMEFVKTGVTRGERWYHDYEFSTSRVNLSYANADESFASLLRAHSLKPETTVVIDKN